MLSVFRTTSGLRVHTHDGWFHAPELTLDALFQSENAEALAFDSASLRVEAPSISEILPPVESQEVWAAGVTYLRSRDARVEESEKSGADQLYDLVYQAARPELFLKATSRRVRGPGQPVRIRRDATWNVPEPELTLAVNARGSIIGYTIGNDMSSRDIEGENPLYLPQAKIYTGSCALGPALVLTEPLAPTTGIHLDVLRSGTPIFHGDTALSQIKRAFPELADWLFRENDFPHGVYLMTGTGIVPPSTFTLEPGDLIRIAIDGLGILENPVE
jgi:2-dehydro-3-deoxy-D-arabinonate dehydratase